MNICRNAVVGTAGLESDWIIRSFAQLGVPSRRQFGSKSVPLRELLSRWWSSYCVRCGESQGTWRSHWWQRQSFHSGAAWLACNQLVLARAVPCLDRNWKEGTNDVYEIAHAHTPGRSRGSLRAQSSVESESELAKERLQRYTTSRSQIAERSYERLRNSHRTDGKVTECSPLQGGSELDTAGSTTLKNSPEGTSVSAESSSDSSSKIVATILSGSSQELVGDCIASVIHLVDQVIVIDTGINDETLTRARNVAGQKLVVRRHAWEENFGSARNFALDCAKEVQATWAITLDTDERLISSSLRGKRELLSILEDGSHADVWHVVSKDGLYAKERIIRVEANAFWYGRTHEALFGISQRSSANEQRHLLLTHEYQQKCSTLARRLFPGLAFLEIDKDQVQLANKLHRDLRLLRDDLKDWPQNARAWYYLGQTLGNLEQFEGAIAAFDRCVDSECWREMASWACFMSAKCCVQLGLIEEATEKCSAGLALDAHTPELAWMCAWTTYKLQEWDQAVCWSKMCIALGCVEGVGNLEKRTGFRDLKAWFEGPFEILIHSYSALGDRTAAEKAKHQLMIAKQLKQAYLNRTAVGV